VEELRREALAQAIVWLPTLAAALSLFILFLVLSRVAHFGVLRIVERTRASGWSSSASSPPSARWA